MKNLRNMMNIKQELQYSEILSWDKIVPLLDDTNTPPKERCPIFTF